MPLNYQIVSTRSTAWDTFARIQIREAAQARDHVFEFKSLFESFIADYKRDSVGSPSMFYKVFHDGDIYAAKECEVWHVTIGMEKKRLVAVIRKA
jgi:hypothetical protein